MSDYEKQYFNILLQSATERFVERIIQRSEGAKKALELLRQNPHGEGVWMDKFVDAFFEEFLIDNVAGSSFILQALSNRPFQIHRLPQQQMSVEDILQRMAKEVFEQLLIKKVEEVLEQTIAFGG